MVVVLSHKANPDEKGTERQPVWDGMFISDVYVTKPIPMKRELKVLFHTITSSSQDEVTKPIPMKRELKGKDFAS